MGANRADLARVLNMTEPDLDRIAYYTDRYLFPFDVSGQRILEIGGANGTISLYLAVERGAHVDIVDEYEGHGSSASNYDVLVSRKEALGVAGEVTKGDVRLADLPASTYDHAFGRNAFHHIHSRSAPDADPIATFARIRGWLKDGGSLTVGDASWISATRLFPPLRKRVFKDFQFASKSTADRWRRCAQRAGFSADGVSCLRAARPLLANRVANVFLTTAYVARFRKNARSRV